MTLNLLLFRMGHTTLKCSDFIVLCMGQYSGAPPPFLLYFPIVGGISSRRVKSTCPPLFNAVPVWFGPPQGGLNIYHRYNGATAFCS